MNNHSFKNISCHQLCNATVVTEALGQNNNYSPAIAVLKKVLLTPKSNKRQKQFQLSHRKICFCWAFSIKSITAGLCDAEMAWRTISRLLDRQQSLIVHYAILMSEKRCDNWLNRKKTNQNRFENEKRQYIASIFFRNNWRKKVKVINIIWVTSWFKRARQVYRVYV